MNAEETKKIRARVNRISGQVNGIGKMVDDERYCLEILDQISAARAALDALGVELLTNHLRCCVIGHGTSSEHECAQPLDQEQLLREVQSDLSRFLK